MIDQPALDAIRKYALLNALQHEGAAQKGAVMSRVLGERSDLRAHAKDLGARVDEVIAKVNALPLEQQRAELESVAPELLDEKKRERPAGLPDLAGAVEGQVVMRMAPGPSGPLHIGHARACVLNDEYVRRYRGKYILRLEDTDPARVRPDAYEMIKQDMAWLGCQVHQVVIQSERFERYYEVARRLLELGHAYVCTHPPQEWRELKDKKVACSHRGSDPTKNLEGLAAMLGGGYRAEEAAVIAKTEIDHPNPAVRDFPILRIEETPHPLTGTKYRVYPLMNFSVAVDDHDLGLTHVLRGKDHLNNTNRQEFLFRHLGWKMPAYIHYGRVSIEGVELSTSRMGQGIDKGEFSGWDDVRLGTIRALARRGYRPESIREYWVSSGVKEVDVVFAWKTLDAIDKKRADPEAVRLFMLERPRRVEAELPSALVGHPPRLPARPEAGIRQLRVTPVAGRAGILMEEADLADLKPGDVFRLKDLANFKLERPGHLVFAGTDVHAARGAPIFHWLPDDPAQTAQAELLRPDGSLTLGRIERESASLHGKVVQLERVGFARLEIGTQGPAAIRANFLYR